MFFKISLLFLILFLLLGTVSPLLIPSASTTLPNTVCGYSVCQPEYIHVQVTCTNCNDPVRGVYLTNLGFAKSYSSCSPPPNNAYSLCMTSPSGIKIYTTSPSSCGFSSEICNTHVEFKTSLGAYSSPFCCDPSFWKASWKFENTGHGTLTVKAYITYGTNSNSNPYVTKLLSSKSTTATDTFIGGSFMSNCNCW